MPAERKGAFLRDGVWHLPVAGSDKAPMLQEALLNLFPVVPPSKGWVLREIASAKEGSRRVSSRISRRGGVVEVIIGIRRGHARFLSPECRAVDGSPAASSEDRRGADVWSWIGE